jgi:hypothetical protein
LATAFGLPATGGVAASISAIAFDTDGHNPDDGNNTACYDGILTVAMMDGSSTTTTVDADGSVQITNANGSTMTAYAVTNVDGSTTMLAGSSAVGERADCNTVTMLALGDTAAAKLTNNDGSITMAVTLPDGSTATVPDAGNGGGGGGGAAEIELELTAAAHDGSVATTAADSSTYTIKSTHNDDRLVQMLYMTDDEGESLHFDLAIPDSSLASVQV